LGLTEDPSKRDHRARERGWDQELMVNTVGCSKAYHNKKTHVTKTSEDTAKEIKDDEESVGLLGKEEATKVTENKTVKKDIKKTYPNLNTEEDLEKRAVFIPENLGDIISTDHGNLKIVTFFPHENNGSNTEQRRLNSLRKTGDTCPKRKTSELEGLPGDQIKEIDNCLDNSLYTKITTSGPDKQGPTTSKPPSTDFHNTGDLRGGGCDRFRLLQNNKRLKVTGDKLSAWGPRPNNTEKSLPYEEIKRETKRGE
jgi:hypothetical protein